MQLTCLAPYAQSIDGGVTFVNIALNFNIGEHMKISLKHSILMASLSTLCVSAHADGISFYALIDGGMASNSIKGAGGTSRTEFVTGGYAPNFVGMTGEKSLGTGLKGGFNVEQGFLLTNNPGAANNSRFFFGSDSIANRQANVFLQGSYGTLKAGTQANIAFKSVLMGDARFGSNYGSSLAAVVIDGGLGTIDTSAISYTSPLMSGFTLAASLVASQRATPTANVSSGSRLSANYAMNNFSATFATFNNNTKSVPATPDANGYVTGVNYKLNAFTLKGSYIKEKNPGNTPAGAARALNNLKTLGFGGAYVLNDTTTFDAGIYRSTDSGARYKMNTLGVGVQYKIIKDLALYAQYAHVKNKDAATVAYNFAGPTIQPGSLIAGQSATTFNIGALYSFF
jgi:predicted porin